MLLTVPVAIYFGEDTLFGILMACLIHLVVGGGGFLMTRTADGKSLKKRDGFIVVALGWTVMSLFGSFPYMLTESIPSFTNAFFETISGFTTTGASILDKIEAQPRSILLWRSLTQWIGGMGIIVLAVAILPILGIGSVQLFSAEAPGLKPDKITPRIGDTAKRLWAIYLGLTLTETALLYVGGMGLFDALNHSLTTVSTGGFSTKQASVGHFDSAFIQYVITAFMLLGGTNFILIYWLVKRRIEKLTGNEELRFYLIIVSVLTVIVGGSLLIRGTYGAEESFRTSAFQVVSMVTTTGYATADYTAWGSGLTMLFFLLLFSGGSAGSTAGGVKMIRHLVLLKNAVTELRRQMHTSAIIPIRVNGKAMPFEMTGSVLAFIMMYILVFAIGSILMAAMSIDFDTAIGAVATALGNVGPGIGQVGPSFSFAALPVAAKWELAFLMLVGRLELFTMILIFTRYFWRKT